LREHIAGFDTSVTALEIETLWREVPAPAAGALAAMR
jgi:hypothetical protein